MSWDLNFAKNLEVDQEVGNKKGSLFSGVFHQQGEYRSDEH